LARIRASLSAASRAESGSARTSTTPSAAAASPEIGAPSIMISLALPMPTRWGRVQISPMSGISPILAQDAPKAASRRATTLSQASARANPPPMAWPSTAATVGFPPASSRRMMRCTRSRRWRDPTGSSDRIAEMSPPAQNTPPEPVTTIARQVSSSCRASKAAISS
jgi:hypothetical protein